VNPDALEVIKAKTTEVTGRLSSLLSLGRASLTGYNRDQQWSKYLIMEACLEGLRAVSIMSRIVAQSCCPLHKNPWLQRHIGVDIIRLRALAGTGFAGVTEFMEQLVSQTGVEFRRLKRVMEHAVALSIQQGEQDCITPIALYQALQEEGLDIDIDAETISRLQDPTTILTAKQVVGGPGRQVLESEIDQLDAFVTSQRQIWEARGHVLQTKYDQCRRLA
jgi:argininosuccinate lyase